MFRVLHPPGRHPEWSYILSVVLNDFLGLEFVNAEVNQPHVTFHPITPRCGSRLRVSSILLSAPEEVWGTQRSMPRQPLRKWQARRDLPEAILMEPFVPVLFGTPIRSGRWVSDEGNTTKLGLDIFGSIFFMLTRYEEIVKLDRDDHDRFPAAASLAYQQGFLERPIVDEYTEILWTCLCRLWPRLDRKRRSYSVRMSHDVDWPRLPTTSPQRIMRSIGGDLVKRRRPGLAARRVQAYLDRRRNRFDRDPYNTFDMLMDVGEAHGMRSAFYFIAGHTAGSIDGEYDLNDPWIQALMRRIHERGHEIGLHPSYNSYNNGQHLTDEFRNLRTVTYKLGIHQHSWGGRQHYLRWDPARTWRLWDEAGIDYDSTVGYADHVGFRAGTTHEYQVFDLLSRSRLALREQPLVVMEATLLSSTYMGLGRKAATQRLRGLANATRRFNGTITVLWHNNYFTHQRSLLDLYHTWAAIICDDAQ